MEEFKKGDRVILIAETSNVNIKIGMIGTCIIPSTDTGSVGVMWVNLKGDGHKLGGYIDTNNGWYSHPTCLELHNPKIKSWRKVIQNE